jgi:hypothetical protein
MRVCSRQTAGCMFPLAMKKESINRSTSGTMTRNGPFNEHSLAAMFASHRTVGTTPTSHMSTVAGFGETTRRSDSVPGVGSLPIRLPTRFFKLLQATARPSLGDEYSNSSNWHPREHEHRDRGFEKFSKSESPKQLFFKRTRHGPRDRPRRFFQTKR